jgi:tetratricopeptide (TPR) repeat protein
MIPFAALFIAMISFGEENPRQIHWLPSLEAAQALAERTGRPLLIAVNMDGESASDRIVRERYRDPEWVALTRPFVCLVASIFRHAPRDFDAAGNRIPCPRLGSVSCAEHITLESVLFERFLGGERIAPRHALVRRDGTKAFDHFLLFDLRELDRSLAAESAKVEGGPIPLAEIEKARAPFHPSNLEFDLLVWAEPSQRAERLRALLARDGEMESPRTRSLLLSYCVEGDPETARIAREALGGEPDVGELERSVRALDAAARSPEAKEADCLALAAWFGAVGRRRDEISIAREGLRRFPESAALHGVLGNAYREGGFFAEGSREAEAIARENPDSATCAWYAGYARIFEAEAARRARDAEGAIAAYGAAQDFFETSMLLNEGFAETAGHYVAQASLGRAFAHLLADRRREAAASLADAIAARPAIAQFRDSLGADVFDLVDGILEWRESDGPSPVDPISLGESLAELDPASPLWWRQISDSELREALRAEGRDEPEEGLRYLRVAVEAGRKALQQGGAELERRAFAQAATTLAERLLDRGDEPAARRLLDEASSVVRVPLAQPEGGARPRTQSGAGSGLPQNQVYETRALARALRELLGPERPTSRPGR